MLEKNNKVSVLTKMIGIGDEKTPQLIVPQNSLTNFHARMGLSEKSVSMAGGGGAQAPSISCPHCQNMAKNFLYLESLIRANGSPKNKCSLCSSTLRYVEYVNKSILDVFAKNASIIEAAQKYSNAKPRFRMPKLMSRVSRLTGGGKKSSGHTTESPYQATTSNGAGNRRQLPKRKTKSYESTMMPKTTTTTSVVKTVTKAIKSKSSEKNKVKTGRGSSSKVQGSKSSLKNGKVTTTARLKARSAESISKMKKPKTLKNKKTAGSATVLRKQSSKTKRSYGSVLRASAA